jgi:glutamine synthetase
MLDVTYIWQDASGNFRSKVRKLFISRVSLVDIPCWNYDGSSTGQATTEMSEVTLNPVKCYIDDKTNNVWVICAPYTTGGIPVKPTNIHDLSLELEAIVSSGLRLGFEQEFFIYDEKTKKPYRYDEWKNTEQGDYYCSVGARGNGFIERYVKEVYERACSLGVHCTGWNLEVAPAQGEIQVCAPAFDVCFDLLFLRYLLWDTLSKYGLYPCFDAKPLGAEWNGSGLHTNVSTRSTMGKGGYTVIKRMMTAMEKTHKEHIAVYGDGNVERLTGIHETSSYEVFSWGIGSRKASVRIPTTTFEEGCGYFEDRRPSANADPCEVCLRIWHTIKGISSEEGGVSSSV